MLFSGGTFGVFRNKSLQFYSWCASQHVIINMLPFICNYPVTIRPMKTLMDRKTPQYSVAGARLEKWLWPLRRTEQEVGANLTEDLEKQERLWLDACYRYYTKHQQWKSNYYCLRIILRHGPSLQDIIWHGTALVWIIKAMMALGHCHVGFIRHND